MDLVETLKRELLAEIIRVGSGVVAAELCEHGYRALSELVAENLLVEFAENDGLRFYPTAAGRAAANRSQSEVRQMTNQSAQTLNMRIEQHEAQMRLEQCREMGNNVHARADRSRLIPLDPRRQRRAGIPAPLAIAAAAAMVGAAIAFILNY
jgi:hypothetical protein